MHREIIFRGIRKDNGEWTYGSLITYDNEAGTTYTITSLEDPTIFVPVIPESIGQFIGLCDCNGRKIYEGDILEYVFTKERYPVMFMGGVFLIGDRWIYIEYYDPNLYTVVDNIWSKNHRKENRS